MKLHGEGLLSLFDPHYQGMDKDVKLIVDQPWCEDELELNESINEVVELEWMIEEENPCAKERLRIYEEDDASMASCETTDCVIGDKSAASIE